MARITMRNSQKSTFAEVFEIYISAVTARGVKDKTLATYKQHFHAISKRLDVSLPINRLNSTSPRQHDSSDAKGRAVRQFDQQLHTHAEMFSLVVQRRGLHKSQLSKLPNIGKAVEEQLIQVGIETSEALREIGAKAAWLKIQEIEPSACIHRLLALEGAIQGVKKSMLPDAMKADLKAFYQEHKL